MPDINISCSITTGSGSLSLQDPGVYKLEASALGERQVGHRRQEVKNPYVEGSYVASSVKEQVTETLAVWVYGSTALQLRQRVETLTDALSQIQYTLTFTQDTATETWVCQPADYTVKTAHEMRVALIALVTAQVPRRPTRTLT